MYKIKTTKFNKKLSYSRALDLMLTNLSKNQEIAAFGKFEVEESWS